MDHVASSSTADRSPAELVRSVFERVLNQRDADALVPYWAENIVEEFPVGVFRGRDAVRRHFAETFAAIPDFHIEVRDLAGDGPKVFVRWHMTGTFSGAPWMGIEPNGKRIALDGIDCFTIENGLVTHNYVVYDQVAFARQIGLLPPFQSAMDKVLTGVFNARTRLESRFRGRRR
jgi:steroid delta-isomerase-like uncharacterized protein